LPNPCHRHHATAFERGWQKSIFPAKQRFSTVKCASRGAGETTVSYVPSKEGTYKAVKARFWHGLQDAFVLHLLLREAIYGRRVVVVLGDDSGFLESEEEELERSPIGPYPKP
jgi:hypothetical protein